MLHLTLKRGLVAQGPPTYPCTGLRGVPSYKPLALHIVAVRRSNALLSPRKRAAPAVKDVRP